jgi:hypothetical protein
MIAGMFANAYTTRIITYERSIRALLSLHHQTPDASVPFQHDSWAFECDNWDIEEQRVRKNAKESKS